MNLFIVGISGKMGKAICENASRFDAKIVGGLDRVPHPCYPTFARAEDVNVSYDALIDFSRPETLDSIIYLTEKYRCPCVIATTGFTPEDEKKIEQLSAKVAVFKAANMSIGIALTRELIAACHRVLGDSFDVEIVEKHHNQKVDSPSGTALLLASAMPDLKPVYGRTGKREKGEVGISSVRGGTVIGVHEVGFYGENEAVTITHTAENRTMLALGALKAAVGIVKCKPALYTDILKL